MATDGTTTYIVCDTTLFSYAEILAIFERNPKNNVLMGTYNPKNHTVITDKEVLR